MWNSFVNYKINIIIAQIIYKYINIFFLLFALEDIQQTKIRPRNNKQVIIVRNLGKQWSQVNNDQNLPQLTQYRLNTYVIATKLFPTCLHLREERCLNKEISGLLMSFIGLSLLEHRIILYLQRIRQYTHFQNNSNERFQTAFHILPVSSFIPSLNFILYSSSHLSISLLFFPSILICFASCHDKMHFHNPKYLIVHFYALLAYVGKFRVDLQDPFRQKSSLYNQREDVGRFVYESNIKEWYWTASTTENNREQERSGFNKEEQIFLKQEIKQNILGIQIYISHTFSRSGGVKNKKMKIRN